MAGPVAAADAFTDDQDALTGAQNDTDPLPSNPNDGNIGSNWEGGDVSPFEADFVWMYDDGLPPSTHARGLSGTRVLRVG